MLGSNKYKYKYKCREPIKCIESTIQSLLYRCRMCMKVKTREINARSKHSFFITSKQIKNPQSLSRCISCVDKLVQHTWPLNDFKIFSVQIPCNLNITCLSLLFYLSVWMILFCRYTHQLTIAMPLKMYAPLMFSISLIV